MKSFSKENRQPWRASYYSGTAERAALMALSIFWNAGTAEQAALLSLCLFRNGGTPERNAQKSLFLFWNAGTECWHG